MSIKLSFLQKNGEGNQGVQIFPLSKPVNEIFNKKKAEKMSLLWKTERIATACNK